MENPLILHLHKVIERLERIQESTKKDGWNYLEYGIKEIEEDIETIKNWISKQESSGFFLDGDTRAILKNLCYKYDCKWIE